MNFPRSLVVDNNSKGNVLAPLWDLKDLTRKENKGFEFLAKARIWIEYLGEKCRGYKDDLFHCPIPVSHQNGEIW